MRQYEDENHGYRGKEASKDRSSRGKRTVHERRSDELEGLSAPNFERFRKRHFATFDDVAPIELSERNREREVARHNHQEKKNGGFVCASKDCREWVCINDDMGTKNRNHCPCCLTSKHMDGDTPGDRDSDCHAPMRAIGLTFKLEGAQETNFSVSGETRNIDRTGELMIIHECSGCGLHRINRVAADDNTDELFGLFNKSVNLSKGERESLYQEGIRVLFDGDRAEVERQLFGINVSNRQGETK